MVPFYTLAFVAALASAAFFYAAGEQEARMGVLWSGVSIVLSALVILAFDGGTLAVFLVQLGYLVAITLFRVWRDPG